MTPLKWTIYALLVGSLAALGWVMVSPWLGLVAVGQGSGHAICVWLLDRMYKPQR